MNTMEEKLVEVTGLERNVELNGKQGTILDYDPKSDRFIICINDEKWKVKLANMAQGQVIYTCKSMFAIMTFSFVTKTTYIAKYPLAFLPQR